MYAELKKAMATNSQNRVDRKNEDIRVKLDEKLIDEEDSALASLKNFKDCSSGPPRQVTPARIFQDVNIQDIIKKSSNELLAGGRKRMSIAQQVYLINKRHIGDYSDEGPNIKYNSARKKGGATDGVNRHTTNIDSRLGIQDATTNYIDYSQLEKEINDMDLAITILDLADNVVGMIPFVGDALSAGITIANLVMAEEIKKKEREIEEKRKENERLLDSFYVFKENMQNQMVLTLSTQADPKIYKKLKQAAIKAFMNVDPNNTPTPREVKMYSNRLDEERNNVINSRKAITDQMTENSTEILDVVGNTLEEQDNEKSALINQGFQARKAIVTEFVKKLKEFVKDFIEEQKGLDKQDELADRQAAEVADIVDKKQEELDDEAEDIAQLKGYSGCKSNVKSQEQMKEDALNELKAQEKQREEDIAQGKISMQGLGKRYKKNSIANQVYLLNARFINSF
jgi:ABC-type lipopolysaccharide export system ATPase subunit